MSQLRAWIVLAVAVSFLAGAAAGVLLERRAAREDASGWAGYARQLTDRFELDAERHAYLLILLSQYDAALGQVRARYEARVQSAMEPELRRISEEYEGKIRDYVLPPGQERATYDDLSRPLILAASR